MVQGRDVTVRLPLPVTPALSGLPPASPVFTGRDRQVGELLDLLAPGAWREAPPVAVVAGLAGVGKTELVVQTAARARERPGWFSGGVLFVDMFGYDTERRLSPGSALGGLLRALGVPGREVPRELQDRSRLYRSVLAAFAERGHRVLVVVDEPYTEELLQDLARAHLVEPGAIWGRWRLHDLVRLFASELGHQQASADRRHAAEHRLHRHYARTARAARSQLAVLVKPQSPLREPRSPRFTRRTAEEWFAAECANLVALVAAAPARGRPATAIVLAAYVAPYLRWEFRSRDFRTVVAVVRKLVRDRADDPVRLGLALLAVSYELDRADYTLDAVDLLVDAVQLLCGSGERRAEERAMAELRHHLLKIVRRGARRRSPSPCGSATSWTPTTTPCTPSTRTAAGAAGAAGAGCPVSHGPTSTRHVWGGTVTSTG